jgi:hypothetical protein
LKRTIDFAEELSPLNRVGWRDPELIGVEKARYPLGDAICYLQGNTSASRLEIDLFGVPRRVARKFALSVAVNDVSLPIDRGIKPGWQTLQIDLAPVPDKSILEVHLHQKGLFRPYDIFGVDDYRELGVGIKRISIV